MSNMLRNTPQPLHNDGNATTLPRGVAVVLSTNGIVTEPTLKAAAHVTTPTKSHDNYYLRKCCRLFEAGSRSIRVRFVRDGRRIRGRISPNPRYSAILAAAHSGRSSDA